MVEKKEVQERLIQVQNEKATEEEFLSILRSVSPGTNLRASLEGAVKIGKGALIVVENPLINLIMDGGFKINCRFTSQRLTELSKMDGAIILSKDMKKINYCNVLLTPDSRIKTSETGTRHKAAERTAKMTGALVIAISERKKEINIYYKNIKYLLRETSQIIRHTNDTLQMLEKQRELFELNLSILNQMELLNDLHIEQACKVIQKGKALQKIAKSIERDLIELGSESYFIKARLKELLKDVEKETNLVIKDYTNLNVKKSKALLDSLSYEELLDTEKLLISLAQKESVKVNSIKGWRLLSKTSLSEQETGLLIQELKDLGSILQAETNVYGEIIGNELAKNLKIDLNRLKNKNILQ